VIVFASALTFFFVNLAPGGPASIMRFDVSPEQREASYGSWVLTGPCRSATSSGSRARSTATSGRRSSRMSRSPRESPTSPEHPHPCRVGASDLDRPRIPIGVVQAVRRGQPIDHLLSLVSAIGLSVPVFWLGIVLILVFAVSLHVLPSAGVTSVSSDTFGDRLAHLVLPAIALATTILPTVARFTRSSMIEVLHEDYVRTATSKGLGRAP